MDNKERDYYEVLGLPRDADEKAIKDAYHRLAMNETFEVALKHLEGCAKPRSLRTCVLHHKETSLLALDHLPLGGGGGHDGAGVAHAAAAGRRRAVKTQSRDPGYKVTRAFLYADCVGVVLSNIALVQDDLRLKSEV